MTNQQESEGNYTYSATNYTYELDFIQDDFYVRSSWASFPIRVAKSLLLLLKTTSINTLRVSWESVSFLAFCLLFVQKRSVSFVYFLENTKDTAVKILMWRRGFLFRPTTHGGLLVLASLALVVGSLFRSGVAPQDFTRDQVLAVDNTPQTLIPEGRPRSEIIKYKVAAGDTVSKIASVYKISIDSVKWANGLESVDEIKPGDTLAIPPVSGIVHKVKKGDDIAAVAKKYKVNAQTIADYPFNYLDDTFKLRVGEMLIVPGGKMPPPKPAPYYAPPANVPPVYYIAGGSGLFAWPVKGTLNQSPSWWHPAIDIGAPYGAPVRAALAGTVTSATYGAYGFGNYVVISHDNGYKTTYAHMESYKVGVGQRVAKGQLIGAVGCSGFCTGPHTHFEVSRGSRKINPLSLLP